MKKMEETYTHDTKRKKPVWDDCSYVTGLEGAELWRQEGGEWWPGAGGGVGRWSAGES